MSASHTWLERQYWSDVMAIRPAKNIELNRAKSATIRAGNPDYLDLAYGQESRQKLDVFLPVGNGDWPVLVFLHGGYWQLGHKDDFAFLAEQWLSRGVAVVILGYRMLPTVGLTDIVADVESGLALLVEKSASLSLNINRVVLSGLSAGAHLSAMQITNPDSFQPRAAVMLSGVYNLSPILHTTPGKVLCDSWTKDLAQISPLGRNAPRDCQTLIVWGAEETSVFASQSKILSEHWRCCGADAQTVPIEGANHFTIIEHLRGKKQGVVNSFIENALFD